VLANGVVEGEPPAAVRPARLFASRRCPCLARDVARGRSHAVPATSLAGCRIAVPSRRSPHRHRPVLRLCTARSGYPAVIAAAYGLRPRGRRQLSVTQITPPSCRYNEFGQGSPQLETQPISGAGLLADAKSCSLLGEDNYTLGIRFGSSGRVQDALSGNPSMLASPVRRA